MAWRFGSRAATLAMLCLAACSLDGITSTAESFNWKAGTASHAFTVGPRTRSYLVHVPPKRPTSGGVATSWPLVIVLHGSSGNGKSVEDMSAMDALADSALFLVAYPDGTGGDFGLFPTDWNAGSCCGGANRDNVDDLAFVSELIRQTATHVSVNSKKIYVAGFSAGARMAYHVGCQLSATVAAVAVVSGSLVDGGCTPALPMPLIAMHGTDDPEVAYDEDAPPLHGVAPATASALPPSVRYWTALYTCTGGTRTPTTQHVTQTRFTKCTTGTDIDFYSIDGGTHGWPGGPVDPGSAPPMSEIRASFLIWQFFARHTHK